MRVYMGDGGSFSIGPFQTCRKTIQPKMGISIFGNLHMWWFPKIWAPSDHPFKIISVGFASINQPFWGTSTGGNPHSTEVV
jgi:hypothetical protein